MTCPLPGKKAVVEHLDAYHYSDESVRFVVPLPWKPEVIQLGDPRTQVMDRFSKLEHSLWKKGTFMN